MKKVYAYLIGACICILICMIIVAITYRNRIYAWTLGDVPALYEKATSLYKSRQYQEALPLFEQLAELDTAAYCKFLLGDLHYRGLAGEVDYTVYISVYMKHLKTR